MNLRQPVRTSLLEDVLFSEGGFTLLFLAPPIVITFLLASLSQLR